jgi:hypothetical protein
MKRLLLLVAAALFLTVVGAQSAGAATTSSPPDGFGGSQNSADHRSNTSGTGNFGQCHQIGAVQGSDSADVNPSGTNSDAADCRAVAGGGSVAVLVQCPPGSDAAAAAQITYRPIPSVSGSSSCS